MKISVITGATGAAELGQAVASVRAQTHEDWEHMIVVDGPGRADACAEQLDSLRGDKRTQVLVLPAPTGDTGYQGHRIYAAFSFLGAGDAFVFLDEDNWLEPEHLATLVTCLERTGAAWAYSLRTVHTRDGRPPIPDNCESLGRWPSYMGDHLVDVGCYFLPRALAVQIAPLWYRKGRGPLSGRADRTICRALLKACPSVATTGLHTLNYRVAGRAESVQLEHFLHGNRLMLERYGEPFPWHLAANERQ